MVSQNEAHKTYKCKGNFVLGISTGFPFFITAALLLIDAAVMALYSGLALLLAADIINSIPTFWRIDRDGGLGERLNHLKWITLVGLSITLFRRQKATIYLGIAALAVVAFLDDSMQLHERFEYAILPKMGFHLPRGAGEMIFVAAEGMVVIGPLLYGWVRAPKTIRRQVIPLFMLIGGIVFCAVAIDFLHLHVSENSVINHLVGIVEDGGEMVFLSLTVSYAAGLVIRTRTSTSA